MQLPIRIAAAVLLLGAAGCTHGPTEPDWTDKPAQSFELRDGARTYDCRKRPRTLSRTGQVIPVYDCR